MIELHRLKYFQTVAEMEHITKASNQLCLAQPALSKTIKSLEADLGVQLFERRNKHVFLNKNGEILLKYARQIDEYVQQMSEEVTDYQEQQSTKTSILIRADSVLLPDLFSGYCRIYPGSELTIITHNRINNERDVKCDFIIDSLAPNSASYACMSLFREEMVVIVPKGHPLTGKRVSLSELKNEEFICQPRGYTSSNTFLQMCRESGFSPRIVMESSDPYTILGCVAAHMGIAVIPEYSWGLTETHDVEIVRIQEQNSIRNIMLIWRKNMKHSAGSECFKHFAGEYFRTLHGDVHQCP